MAKIKYSALVSDMRNKLNGSVMSANRYGSYIRNKVTPVNPQTSFQQNARALFGALSSDWRGLTDSQRASWISATKEFPFTDIFGDTKHLSGQSLFVKLNANLEYTNGTRKLSAPAPVAFPDFKLGLIDETDSIQTGIDFDFGDAEEIPAGFGLAVYVTDPIPPGVNFVKNRFRRMPGAIGSGLDAGTFQYDGVTYSGRFGAIPAGYTVRIRVALVSLDSGQMGVPFELTKVEPAA